MKILVMAGHTLSGLGTGAVGHINESKETRVFAPLLVKYLKMGGANVTYVKLDRAVTKDYLAEQVRLANNSGKFDLVIQIHFNAGSKDPDSNTTGCEVYAYDNNGKKYAEKACSKVSSLLRNRGAKINQNLYWLRNTRDLAILIEVCFVDDKDDTRVYNDNKDKIAKLMAEGILSKSITDPKPPIQTENTYYRVVTNSYTVRSYAEKEVSELKKLGYSAFLDAFKKDGKSYLRVVAGSYTNRSNADKLIIELKNKGYNPFMAIYKK